LATRAFEIALALGVIGTLFPIFYRRGTMPTWSAEVAVDLDLDTALRDIAQALLVLDEKGEVTVDADARSAWLDTPLN
jgi:hypothetical protein